mgnify:CR=1 FL=1
MTFLVKALDYPAPLGPQRRQTFRPKHLRFGEELYRQGRWRFAAGILNEASQPIGSLIICEFESRQQLEEEWLSQETYLLNKVWEKIEIYPIKPAPFMGDVLHFS